MFKWYMTDNFRAEALHLFFLTGKHLIDLTVVVIITKISDCKLISRVFFVFFVVLQKGSRSLSKFTNCNLNIGHPYTFQ